MQVKNVPPSSRIVDSLPFSQGGTAAQAKALKASGVDGLIGYLGAMNQTRLGYVIDAGLGFMPVTFAGEYKDGAADEIAQIKALRLPSGVTTWLDLEGLEAWNTPVDKLGGLIETWGGDIVTATGNIAGLYVGAPQPFTGKQLFALKNITRYWLGIGRCRGKDGLDAYPDCGYCLRQDWHDNPDLAQHNLKGGMLWKDTGVFVDGNSSQADHKGRHATWVVA